MSKSRKAARCSVATLPHGYCDGVLPTLTPRTDVYALPHPKLPAGAQPSGIKVSRSRARVTNVEVVDAAVLDLMILETQHRDGHVDNALADILRYIHGKELNADTLHWVRMRLRELGDEVHRLTRVAAAVVGTRERVRSRCKFDPVRLCRMVKQKCRDGAKTTDAFFEVADEVGAAFETVRNAYYKHWKTVSA